MTEKNIHPVDFGDTEMPEHCHAEYRRYRKGEQFHNGHIWQTAYQDQSSSGYYIVAVPDWTPPDWLKPGWVAMDANGSWYWHKKEPTIHNSHYDWRNESLTCARLNDFNWTPPPCTDWTTSKRKIPRFAILKITS